MGYYDDDNEICEPCHHSCLGCDDGPNFDQCTSCNTTDTQRVDNHISTGQCPCDIGTIDNGSMICLSCHYTCYTCTQTLKNNCIDCNDLNTNRYLNNSQCLCKSHYYNQEDNSICLPCDSSCSECDREGQNNCISCPTDYTLYPVPIGSCRKCEDGQIFNEIYECIACNKSSCKTCELEKLDYCLTCMNETLQAYKGTCCDDTCDGCLYSNSSACTACRKSSYYLNGKTNGTCIENATLCSPGLVGVKYDPPDYSMNKCLEECPEGLVLDSNNVCSACYFACKTCSEGENSSACLTCKQGFELKINECIVQNKIVPKMSQSSTTIPKEFKLRFLGT
eukprot:TRINITY_DN3343_c0_g1_i3.p1 TRINITY_DN3343_c0_g1~~TRINITY_DN3343_c0_g1_i3.p1  ORF type:complete len:336 (-),score=70.03 TRINITY_DN3343_c0_g1_i3:451-1458(-)